MRIILALALLFCALIDATFAVRSQWNQQKRASPTAVVPITFTLKQQNLQQLQDALLDVSSPKSKNYGNWWTKEQILDLVAPSAEISERVESFLTKNGATSVKNERDVIISTFTVEKAEQLLQTRLYDWVHTNGKSKLIAVANGYTVPEKIADYVDVISGVMEFPNIRRSPVRKPADDKEYVIPQTIQKIYNIPTSFTKTNSTICLAEFQGDTSYSPADLSVFVQQMNISNITVDRIVGPFTPDSPDLEATLDVQYGGAVAVNQSTVYWTVAGWMMEFATALNADKTPPLVVSMSWGWPEPEQCQIEQCTSGTSSHDYVNRVNVEFQKAGLRGITLMAASGDQGAPGDGDAYCQNSTSPLSTIFPGASPWVLSVGATMLKGKDVAQVTDAAKPPICDQFSCALDNLEEITCSYPQALITTGGGFSNYSPRLKVQDKVVAGYLKNNTLPKKDTFNPANRGFPDISALGHNYLINANNQFEQVDGTSCSSPVIGGIVALLNAYRIEHGKKPLGYIIPLIYEAYEKNPAIYNDITVGDNKCTESCCDDAGFVASKGWDPVTGLGTPNFELLLNYVKTLA